MERPSVVTVLGALVGNTMDTDWPDANQCCSCHQGLKHGSLHDKEGTLSWRDLYCEHGEKHRVTRQTPFTTALWRWGFQFSPPKVFDKSEQALLSNWHTESVIASFLCYSCAVMLAAVLSVGFVTKAAWLQGFTIYIKIPSLLFYSSNKRRVCLVGLFPLEWQQQTDKQMLNSLIYPKWRHT